MRRNAFLFSIFLALILTFSGCSLINRNEGGTVKIYMKDAPIDLNKVEHIYITISEISAQKAGEGFVTVLQEETTLDLKELMETRRLVSEVNLDEGRYTQLRLVVTKGEIVYEGISYDLEIPSVEVKIPCVFEVTTGGTVEIILDFDAKKSILVVEAGVSLKFILRPVIVVESINYQ